MRGKGFKMSLSLPRNVRIYICRDIMLIAVVSPLPDHLWMLMGTQRDGERGKVQIGGRSSSRLISFPNNNKWLMIYWPLILSFILAGLQNASFKCCADCPNHLRGSDRILADHRKLHPGLLLHSSACCLRPNAGFGWYARQRVDARDVAGKTLESTWLRVNNDDKRELAIMC